MHSIYYMAADCSLPSVSRVVSCVHGRVVPQVGVMGEMCHKSVSDNKLKTVSHQEDCTDE